MINTYKGEPIDELMDFSTQLNKCNPERVSEFIMESAMEGAADIGDYELKLSDCALEVEHDVEKCIRRLWYAVDHEIHRRLTSERKCEHVEGRESYDLIDEAKYKEMIGEFKAFPAEAGRAAARIKQLIEKCQRAPNRNATICEAEKRLTKSMDSLAPVISRSACFADKMQSELDAAGREDRLLK